MTPTSPVPEYLRCVDPPLDGILPSAEIVKEMPLQKIRDLLASLTRSSVTGMIEGKYLPDYLARSVEVVMTKPSVLDVQEGIVTPGQLRPDEVGDASLYYVSMDVDCLAYWNSFGREVGNLALRRWAEVVAACVYDVTSFFESAPWEPDLRIAVVHQHGDEFAGLVHGSYRYLAKAFGSAKDAYAEQKLHGDALILPDVSYGSCDVHQAVYVNRLIEEKFPGLVLQDLRSRKTRIISLMKGIAECREQWLKKVGRIAMLVRLRADDAKVYDAVAPLIRKAAGDMPDREIGRIANTVARQAWFSTIKEIVDDQWVSRRHALSRRGRTLVGQADQGESHELDARIMYEVISAALYLDRYDPKTLLVNH